MKGLRVCVCVCMGVHVHVCMHVCGKGNKGGKGTEVCVLGKFITGTLQVHTSNKMH